MIIGTTPKIGLKNVDLPGEWIITLGKVIDISNLYELYRIQPIEEP